MSGLVGYGSSDEDDDDPVTTSVTQLQVLTAPRSSLLSHCLRPRSHLNWVGKQAQTNPRNPIDKSRPTSALVDSKAPVQDRSHSKAQQPSGASHNNRTDGHPKRPLAEPLPVGPSLGPSRPAPASHAYSAEGEPLDPSSRPPSPHSAYREAMQSLTLPTVPDFSIPDSPPGSPAAGADARVAHFLDLKRAQGLHFNERLAGSSALKNPGLLGKLVASAGLPAEAQYASSLPPELWDPRAFPRWAFKEELERARVKADRAREAGKAGRRGVDFVKGPPEA